MNHKSLSLLHPARLAAIALAGLVAAHAEAAEPKFGANVSDRFGPQPPFSFSELAGLLARDFDGDSHPDIAVTGNTILRISFGDEAGNTRTGGFFGGNLGTPIPLETISEDLNGDGRPDLIFIYPTDSSAPSGVECFLNDGAGRFSNTPATVVRLDTTVAVPIPQGVATGDFNGDGFPDLVISGQQGSAGNRTGLLAVYLSSTGAGGAFTGYAQPPVVFQTGTALGGRVAIGNLNGDGFPDVVVANEQPSGSGMITYFYGDPAAEAAGSVNLIAQTPLNFGTAHPVALAIDDTIDGSPKVWVTAHARSGGPTGIGGPMVNSTLSLLSMSAGELVFASFFQLGVATTTATDPRSDVALRDVNGDGGLEILTANSLDANLYVVDIDPLSGGLTTFPLGATGFERLAVADFNHDDQADVAVAGLENFVGLLNTTGGGSTPLAGKAIQFSAATYEVIEGTALAKIKVLRGSASTGVLTVPFSVAGTATRHPKLHSDYNLADPADRKLSFAAGEFSKEITLQISNDAGYERAETVTFTLANPLANPKGTPKPDAVLGTPKAAKLTIFDSELPIAGAPGALTIVPSNIAKPGVTNPLPVGIKARARTQSDWTFRVTQAKDRLVPGLAVKLQYSFKAAPGEIWYDLAPMVRLTELSPTWILETIDVPEGFVVFRTLTTAPGYQPYGGKTSARYEIIAGPRLDVFVTQDSPSDVNLGFIQGPLATHLGEDIVYNLHYRNTGTGDATDVVVYAAVPKLTRYLTATARDGATLEPYLRGGQVVAVRWKIAKLLPGAEFNQDFVVTTHQASDFSKTDPTAGFGKVIEMHGFDIEAKAQGIEDQNTVIGNETLKAVIHAPLELKVKTDDTQVAQGGIIAYELTMRNVSAVVYPGGGVTARIPFGTVLGSVFVPDANGNSTSTVLANPSASTNPAIVFVLLKTTPLIKGKVGDEVDVSPLTEANLRLLLQTGVVTQQVKWSLGDIPANATRTVKYTVRVLYDLRDETGKLFTQQVINEGFDFTAGGAGSRISARSKLPPVQVVSNLTPGEPVDAPSLGLSKRALGDVLLNAPGIGGNGELEVSGQGKVATVAQGHGLDYELTYENTGNAAARGVVIHDVIPAGTELRGYFTQNGGQMVAEQITYYDKLSRVMGNVVAENMHLVRSMDIRLSQQNQLTPLPAGGKGKIRYTVVATVKPAAETNTRTLIHSFGGYALKAKQSDPSQGYYMTSTDLVRPRPGTPEELVAVVVANVSFAVDRATKNLTSAKAGDQVSFDIAYAQNGDVASSDSKMFVAIPAGAVFEGSAPPEIFMANDTRRSLAAGESVEPFADSITINLGTIAAHSAGKVRAYFRMKSDYHPALIPLIYPASCAMRGTYLPGQPGALAAGAARGFGGLSTVSSLAPVDPATFIDLALTFDPIHGQFQTAPRLLIGMDAPWTVKRGEQFTYTIFFGNSGDATARGVKIGLQVPFGTKFISASMGGLSIPSGNFDNPVVGSIPFTSTTRSGSQAKDAGGPGPDVVTWNLGDQLVGHAGGSVQMTVEVSPTFSGTSLTNNSGYITEADTATEKRAGVVIGKHSVHVRGESFAASIEESIGSFLSHLGFGKVGLNGVNANSRAVLIAGADGLSLANGAAVIPLGKESKRVLVVASSLVAQGGGNIVASGGGNIVASGGGNIVASGGGNFISVTNVPSFASDGSVSYSTRTSEDMLVNAKALVAQGGGNIVASGGGNLIGNDGGSLLSNLPGGASSAIAPVNRSLVASGGGNLVAQGGGNIVASGGGNLIGNDGGSFTLRGLIANDGGTLVASGGGNIIGWSSGNVISFRGLDIPAMGENLQKLIGNDVGTLIGNDGGSFAPR